MYHHVALYITFSYMTVLLFIYITITYVTLMTGQLSNKIMVQRAPYVIKCCLLAGPGGWGKLTADSAIKAPIEIERL